MGNYIRRVTLFAIGNTIREAVVTVAIGNYIRRVIVIGGSLYSRVYGIWVPMECHIRVSTSLHNANYIMHHNSAY